MAAKDVKKDGRSSCFLRGFGSGASKAETDSQRETES